MSRTPRSPSTYRTSMEDLTPTQIVAELDKYIVGQKDAKRAVAIALRNRYRRRMLAEDLRDEVIPKNILMIGPTGVGKTEIARRLANLAHAPFIKVEATKFTEVGYVGRDVDSMVRDLAQVAVRMVESEKIEEVREEAEERAIERVTELLHPPGRRRRRAEQRESTTPFHAIGSIFGHPISSAPPAEDEPEAEEEIRRRDRDQRIRARLKQQVKDGLKDDEKVDIEVETSQSPFVQVFSGH